MSLAVAAGVFACAWAAFLAGPTLLGRRRWAVRHPAAALRLWAGLLVVGATGAGLGLVLVLRSAAEVSRELGTDQQLTACETCHAAAVYGASWVMTAAVATSVCMAGYGWAQGAGQRRRLRRATRGAADGLPSALVDGVRLSLLTSETYAAAGTPGLRPRVVVTTALRALLDDEELRSVVAHETAHLRHGHRLVVAIARAQGRCLPGAWGAEAHRSLHLLVELAADDRAAQRCGPGVTAAALTKVAAASDDDAMRLRARRTSLVAA